MLTVLMILCLLAGFVPAFADEAAVVYVSDFSKDTDGWYGRGASVALRDGALRAEGRTSDWNSPGRDFELIEGGKYHLSVQVRQEEMDSANFMISVAHSKDGMETYENLAFGAARKGEWVKLEGDYTAGAFDRFVRTWKLPVRPSWFSTSVILPSPLRTGCPLPSPQNRPWKSLKRTGYPL